MYSSYLKRSSRATRTDIYVFFVLKAFCSSERDIYNVFLVLRAFCPSERYIYHYETETS